MIKFFTCSIFFIALYANSQSFEISAGAGTGAYYFIEEADNSVNTAYDSPASIFFDLKYNFKDRFDGMKMRFQNTSVNVVGDDYQTRSPLDGTVESFTISALYERLRADKVFNIGYNVGLGFTQQDFVQIKNNNIPALEDRFVSVTANGIFSLRLHDQLRLIAETGVFWTDPINSFKGTRNWQTAGEDVSLLLQAGISYRFK
ncbi:hypothetical protein SAMN05192588_1389 [Nonlabens sp. Hel1_33_55]|uniref:hypothetical protein n=1 Tax=Nonlabens sp. Hel1_33_55 TaxID=1336802 RepID=UPI000875D013|nr:hypothetical protein [Nonlabens sp. Hel1_33_55]SCY14941.1 hypothetical protein SAMN05192588_1389 [Nonlabens sp. Hel1_33_55]